MAVHRISKGLDLPLAGDPVQAIDEARPVGRVALLGADYHGMRPTLLVKEGDRVLRGQPLFEDKKTPGVLHTAPAAGTVAAINRGEMRVFQSLVVDVADDDGADAQVAFAQYRAQPVAGLDAAAIRALLQESGLWTALRTRPFSRVPAPAATPHSIFVTAIDTRPHAPQVAVVLAGREADFEAGLAALTKLAPKVFLCRAPGTALPGESTAGVRVEQFSGPHPAGTAGLHIHLLDPVHEHKAVWHVGYQDVAAIGRLLLTGKLDVERVVALAGPGVLRPRLLRTRLGAALDELTRGELKPGDLRVISGSVLEGRSAAGPVHGFLGRHDQQVSVLAEGRERELFGWITPGFEKFSVWRVVAGALARNRRLALTTTANGSSRPMVPTGAYERVMPMDVLPTFLLRALITDDVERAEALGVLELDEEDLALCTYVCAGKFEYGPLLRKMLTHIEKEHA
ncbi:MAG: Na(+)-translocating NADH-quinone reductase subunit A [Betaproteobacteria bacterium]|nr:Na(+)-translocating NADH-quinone reductase subunit A [Betaproteobacteria bacterium]